MRRANRVDGNHSIIIDTFRKMGCSVWDTSRMGEGGPDCVVARWQKTICVEIKDGNLSPSRRALTPEEIRFRREWKGIYVIVESVDDALMTVKVHLS